MRTCKKCQVEKSMDDFYHQTDKRYRMWTCKICTQEGRRSYKEATREQKKIQGRDYYRRNREAIIERTKVWHAANRDKSRLSAKLSMRRQRAIARQAILDAYGNACACCGETMSEFLALDHIHNDGREHRKAVGSFGSARVYADVIKQGFPKDRFQLLCHSCNMAKAIYGACPHQQFSLLAMVQAQEQVAA